jgi:uncharacterized membrane protein YdjX (TVP38/TMEM64 family)
MSALRSPYLDPELRRSLLAFAGIGVLLALAFLARNALGIEWNAESVRDSVHRFGVWGPVVFVGLMTFRAFLLVPSQIMLVAGGLIFGALAGTLYGTIGLVISGSAAFAIARWAGRDAVLDSIPENMRWAFLAAGSRTGAAVVVVGTGYPVGPLTAFHAGAGLTAMSIPIFLAALTAGALIRAAIYAWFGDAIMAGDRTIVIAGTALLVATIGPLLHPASRAWLKKRVAP